MSRNPYSSTTVTKKASAPSCTPSSKTLKHDNNPSYSPQLQKLLDRLRPFQREAFKFATQGSNTKLTSDTEPGPKKKRQRTNIITPPRDEKGITHGGNGRILLADEMGLGKTVTSLAIMTHYLPEWPLLILCPASLRHTWPAEIEKFLPSLPPSSTYIISGFDDADFYSNPHKRQRIKIVIATYSLLQTRSAAARVLDQFDFKCVIVDESHNLKERTSQRCKLAMPLLQKARRLVLLSGTPALARPVELWSQLHCLDANLFGTYTAYTKQYCNARRGRFGWDVTGLSNADELHEKLQTIMVRRLKSDVLTELPPKQRSIVPVKMDKEYIKSCQELIEDLQNTRQSVEELVGTDAYSANFEAKRLLMAAYQSSGIGKAKSVSEFVLDWLSGSTTQKVLVFAHHKEVMDTLEHAISKKLKGIGHIRIDGTVSPSERALRVKKFQTSAQIRVALLSMTAAGVGLTLTAATSVIFAELHWTPGVLAQAEDRCHRIGQCNAVNVMYCVCKEGGLSVDLQLWRMLGKKIGTLGRVIDGNKRATLNADDTGANPAGQRNSSGVSAEEELSSFFAETSPSDAASSASKVPVKGSIQSFFKKMNTATSTAIKLQNKNCKSTTENAERDIVMVTPSKDESRKESSTVLSSKKKPVAKKNRVEEEELVKYPLKWTCHACTFINTKLKPSKNLATCMMCGTLQLNEKVEKKTAMMDETVTIVDIDESDLSHTTTTDEKYYKEEKIDDCVEVIDIEDDDEPRCNVSNINDSTKEKSVSTSPQLSSSMQIIELCDEKPKTVDVVDLDFDSDFGESNARNLLSLPSTFHTPPSRKKESPQTNFLSFSVSKNSGRVAIHAAETGEALCVNFDIHQVVTDATSDYFLEQTVKRVVRKTSKQAVQFDDAAVKQVIDSIDTKLLRGKGGIIPILKVYDELKQFVTSYLSLREIEKKKLREWGEPVTLHSMRRILSTLLAPTVTNGCNDRYGGGAKERALENKKNHIATQLDEAVLNGVACAWCAAPLFNASLEDGVESTYCSQKCAEEGRLRRGGISASTRIRSQIFELEGGVCRKCGIDANALFLRISALQPAERLNALCNANWNLPKSGPALERILQNPKEGDFWQADHILAVAEGGGNCGLENLQTLCTPCHKLETEKLRARLRLSGGVKTDGGSLTSPSLTQNSQMDIRSAFFCNGGSKSKTKKRRQRTAD